MADPQRTTPSVFEIVEDLPDHPASQKPKTDPGMAMFILGMKTLSARALAAVADLFTLATVGSAFWLWLSIHEPDVYQLVSEAMYGLFVLAANWIVRRGR